MVSKRVGEWMGKFGTWKHCSVLWNRDGNERGFISFSRGSS